MAPTRSPKGATPSRSGGRMQKPTTTPTSRSRAKVAAAAPTKPVRAAKPKRNAVPVPEPVEDRLEEELDEEVQAAPADPSEYPEKVKFILDVLDDMKAVDVETYYVV